MGSEREGEGQRVLGGRDRRSAVGRSGTEERGKEEKESGREMAGW